MNEPRASDPNFPPTARPHLEVRSWRRWSGRGLVLVIVAVGFYSLGRYAGARLVEEYHAKNAQLTSDNSKLGIENRALAVQIASLQDQLKEAKIRLDEISGPARRLEIKANDSKPVSIAQMEIGLVGTPDIQSVNINIDGKKQSATAGDIVSVDFTCRIHVVSFDVLKSSASINSACAVKP